MKKGLVSAVVVFLLVLSGLLFWLGRDAGAGARAPSAGGISIAGGGGASAAGVAVAPASFKTGLENLPASLRGTEVDGQLEVDAKGHLKISNGIRHIFDYFLSTVGEEPVDTIVARIHAYLHSKLKDPARAEADDLLNRYIGYKKALDGMPSAQPVAGKQIDVVAVQQQMDQVAALRQQYFSPEVIQAFFGDEDAYDRYSLARLQVLQNKGLTTTQRAQQLAALEQQLPPALRDSLKTVNQYQDLQSAQSDCKQRGCSAPELRQVRESIVGAEAADRLEQLDQQNAAWDQRMNSWYSQRAAILGDQSLSDGDRQAQIAQLRSGLFTAQEQVRVQALERLHDGGQKPN